MKQNQRLARAQGVDFSDPERYRRILGRLIYLTVTRSEPCYAVYAVHIKAQLLGCPKVEHWDSALCVLRYRKGCPGQGLLLRNDSHFQLYAFCDFVIVKLRFILLLILFFISVPSIFFPTVIFFCLG